MRQKIKTNKKYFFVTDIFIEQKANCNICLSVYLSLSIYMYVQHLENNFYSNINCRTFILIIIMLVFLTVGFTLLNFEFEKIQISELVNSFSLSNT